MKGRKIVSLLLALTLIMATLPVQVFAQDGGRNFIVQEENSFKKTTPGAIKLISEEIDFENYPEDVEEYAKWKQEVLEKLKQHEQNEEKDKIGLQASSSKSGSVENEYVKFFYNNGTYGLHTTGGNPDNPNDNNKRLLYGNASTSYTTIRINGVNHRFRPDSVTEYDNKIIGTKRYGDLIVSQHISIIPNQYTNRDDVVEFFYTVENTGDTDHDVGVRIMFDTQLGSNDSAPFKLPVIGDVTTETELSGHDIPEFWQAFDSLTNPNIIAQGTLKVDKSSTPDRVRFTNWGSATSNPWDYTRTEGSSNGDSAVCLYWNEESIGKNDVLSCKTFYGLSAMQEDLRPPLAVALSGATKLEVVEGSDGKEEYSPNPFTVTAYIQNVGSGPAENANITLDLPEGMEVVGGGAEKDLGNIPVGTKQHQVSWKVKVAPSSMDKVEKYGVTVTADNTDPKTLEREISIPKLKTSGVKLLLDRNCIENGNTLDLNFKIINEGEEVIDLSQLYTRYYYLDESPSVDKQINVDWAQFDNPYGSLKTNITTKSVQNITPTRENANGYMEFGFNSSTNNLLAGQEAEISARVNNSTWGNMIMDNDYSYMGDGSPVSEGYAEWEYMPIYNKNNPDQPVWGSAPAVDDTVPETDLLIEFNSMGISRQHYMNLDIRVTNKGLEPVELDDLNLKYYYTNDNWLPQSVVASYVGGRINNRTSNITNKVEIKVEEMAEVKEMADHYVNIDFGQGAGAISNNDYVDLSIQVYNTGWEHGEYIVENDHSYHTEDTMNMLNTGLAPYNSVVDTRAKRVVWSTRSTREKGGLAPGRVVPRLVTVGNPVASDLYRGGAEHWYEFKTSNAGAYIIDTLGLGYTSGTLYKKKLLGQLERVAFNSGGINFKILTGLEKNTTYYIKVGANTSPALENYILSVRGNEDIMVSTSGGSWMPKMTGFPDPDGPYVHVDKIVYLPKEEAMGYYIMVSSDEFKKIRDDIIDQSFNGMVAYLMGSAGGFLARPVAEFIASNVLGFTVPSLTDLELEELRTAGRINSEGMFTQGIKIASMTTYRLGTNGNIIPMMQNVYTGWDGEIMYGQKYYRGIFSKEKKPMWR